MEIEKNKSIYENGNSIVSLSNVLIALNENTSVIQRKLFYSTIATFNPFDQELVNSIEQIKTEKIEELKKEYLKKKKDLSLFNYDNQIILKDSIEFYFSKNIEKCRFYFDFKELMSFWQKDYKVCYSAMNDALRKMSKITYSYEYLRKNKKVNDHIPVFSKLSLSDNQVLVEINYNFMPFLVFLSEVFDKGYSKFNVELLINKNNQATFSVLSLLLKFYRKNTELNTQTFKFEIDVLRKHLGLQKKYKAFKDFRLYLETAQKEINEDENMNLDLKYEKNGRSFKYVILTFTLSDLFNNNQNSDEVVLIEE